MHLDFFFFFNRGSDFFASIAKMDAQYWLDCNLVLKSNLTFNYLHTPRDLDLLAIFLHEETFMMSVFLSEVSPMNNSIR